MKEYRELVEEKEKNKNSKDQKASFSIVINKSQKNEPSTRVERADIFASASINNPSISHQDDESPQKSSFHLENSKNLEPNTYKMEVKEKSAKIQIASLLRSKIHKFVKKQLIYSNAFFAKYSLNRLSISDIVSIKIEDYKAYIDDPSEKEGKVGKPIKKIQNFLDWYLGKNISDILSNQMFHECFFILERLKFSPDMTKLAYATFDHSIRIDTLKSDGNFEQNDFVFKYHTKKIIKIDFSNDGTKLVTLGLDKCLVFWDINAQTFLFKIKPENENFHSFRFAHSDKYFATGTDDSLLMIWTIIDDGKKSLLKHLFQDHKKTVTTLDFSREDQYLCSGSEDKTIMMHDVESGELLHCFKEHYDTVTSVRFSPNNNTFVSGSRDKKMILWNADEKCKIKNFKNRPEEIAQIRYSPDGSQIYSVDNECNIFVFDTEGNVKLGPLKEHDKNIETLGFIKGKDGKDAFVTASRDKFIVKWDTQTGKILKKPLSKYPMDKNYSHSFISYDSQKIITMSNPPPIYNNTMITRWKAGSGIPEEKMEYQNIIFTMMTFSTNSESFAGVTKDSRIFLWKVSNIKAPFYVIELPKELDITSMAYYVDRDTEFLAAGSSDKQLNLWDTAKKKLICDEKEGHEAAISLIKFSFDGLRVATYSHDYLNTIAIWNPTDGVRLFGLMEHGKFEITSIKFSPDSSKMACGNKLGTVYIYTASTTTSSKWKLFPKILDMMRGPITALSFSKYNSKIATACQKGKSNEISVWDYTTGNLQIGPLVGHHYEISAMCFSREDSVLTSFSKDSLKAGGSSIKALRKSTLLILMIFMMSLLMAPRS